MRSLQWGLLILGFVLWTSRALGQVDVKLNGYLEHQYSVSYHETRWSHLDYDRLRGDLNASAGRSSRVSAAVIWQLYRGDTRIPLHTVLPDALDELVDTLTADLRGDSFVNHAFISLNPGGIELTAGKQFLTWGAAWAFNPTELFRPKNLLEPTYEREGVGAISARIPLGPVSDVLVAFVPNGEFATSGHVVRARHQVGGFDFSTLVATLFESTISEELTAGTQERRLAIGGDITGEVLGMGLWSEATWSDHAGKQWLEMTLGGNYTLANSMLLLLEAYYNGRGEWEHPYANALWMARLHGNVRSLGKVLGYASVSRPIGAQQLWNVGISALANAGDPSGVLIPSVSYAFGQNVDLLFNALLYVGDREAEFGGRHYGAFVRGRIYF